MVTSTGRSAGEGGGIWLPNHVIVVARTSVVDERDRIGHQGNNGTIHLRKELIVYHERTVVNPRAALQGGLGVAFVDKLFGRMFDAPPGATHFTVIATLLPGMMSLEGLITGPGTPLVGLPGNFGIAGTVRAEQQHREMDMIRFRRRLQNAFMSFAVSRDKENTP